MKFGQVMSYNKRNIFFKNYEEIEAGRLVPNSFFVFLEMF